MGQVYQWVRNILFFLLLVSLTEILLPSGKYGKYIRFFTGMVMILLTVRPLLAMFQLEDRLAGYFDHFSFQMETDELNREILGIERQRLDRIADSYELEAERNIAVMAAEEGLELSEVKAAVERDREKENYGQIRHILLVIREDSSGDRGTGGGETAAGEEAGQEAEKTAAAPVGKIQTVQVEIRPVKAGGAGGAEAGTGGDPADGSDGSGVEMYDAAEAAEIPLGPQTERLRRKVEIYYGLESEELEIRLEKLEKQ